MNYINNDVIDVNITRNKTTPDLSGYNVYCYTCRQEFKLDQIKVDWRLKYRNYSSLAPGSFWLRQCQRCAVDTIEAWRSTLNAINIQQILDK